MLLAQQYAEQSLFFTKKTFGLIDESYLSSLDVWRESNQVDGGVQMARDIGVLQQWVIQNPNFHPVKTVESQAGQFQEVPDLEAGLRYPMPVPPEDGGSYCSHHPTETLGSRFGDAVVAHVMKVSTELMLENGSGRYPVTKLWHPTENRELRIDEALQTYINTYHEFFVKWKEASATIAKVLQKKKTGR